jgi:cell division protein FtsI (penicillin-binding protein 3)
VRYQPGDLNYLKYGYGAGSLIIKTTFKFVNHVNSYGFNKKLNMDLGRKAFIPKRKSWSNISASMDGLLWSFGNTNADLMFYNVANNG